ncbi:NADH-quinone oxidoreductase subunit NuoN [Geodermatophilus obscurus]|uniref:NADH-quinone oxidoreductase subunit N n=1 Tax=Geodermatophilus obscurus (strain ATCC 25078 / DSM 43160 / JCM 3152 / CCUG 61914 / KCC A-0152 / KCTC 9177 / NBRC 13315 / NRRL B-3577 / G-20) TaxID=526225 RepID=D2SHE1_GEOOG|nr:NADH-quinone oxidoreductase subunit NuoN [Geodermatophilus obscurus]ADB77095.1 proton-translocating NADH-quinone oxidoreductase, chain N [Geodermatophilus obscurus DSM 43160]
MIEAPALSLAALAPLLFVFGAACVGVLVEAFAPRESRHPVQVAVALVGTLGGLVTSLLLAGERQVTAGGALAVDGPAVFLQATIAGLGALSLLLFAERSLDPARSAFVAAAAVPAGSPRDRELMTAPRVQTEVYPLATFAIGGMMLFVAANDLLVMFVALEVLSLPLYLISGLARRRRLLSQEAAVKYFLLGAFASAFFLYGLALVYGATGSIRLSAIREASAAEAGGGVLLVLGLALLVVGLMFKASVAPFHAWTPDVYQGAPTPVTAFMAACTKVAAFGAILRLLYVAFGTNEWTWRPLVYGIAIVSMVVGAVLGLTQTDLKRMLAYSSIAHAGFLLTGVLGYGSGADGTGSGLGATMFYLLAYGLTTIGAFAVLTLVRDGDGEATHLSKWAGLGRRSPLTAAVMALFLLALAGIPLTSGFTGKFAVFRAAIDDGAWPLVVVALLASAVAAFFYVRVIVLMYFSEPAVDGPTVGVPGLPTTLVLAVTVTATVVLGVVPGAVLDLAEQAARFVG